MKMQLRPGVSGLNVRPGPGAEYGPPVKVMRPGEVGEVLGASTDAAAGAWVWLKGPDGWVALSYLAQARESQGGWEALRPRRATWRIAGSLERLAQQVDAMAPRRSKSHDGTIGDAAHAARKSDHNPNAAGVVTALDITHDPEHGCDCAKIAAALVDSRDPRIKYLIFKGRILSSKVVPWTWRKYTGENQHTKHLHISVEWDPALYDDARDWRVK